MTFATAPFAAFEDVVQLYDGVLATADHDRVTGLLRRAARSLRALVGDLTQYEADLVTDTLVDAVIRRLDNPRGFASETDGDYSYRYFKGSDGFWWPGDWAALFGVTAPVRGMSTRVPSQWRGWAAR